MSVKIIQDMFYKVNQDGDEVFTLITSKSDGISYSRSYTLLELETIADKIKAFIKDHNAATVRKNNFTNEEG